MRRLLIVPAAGTGSRLKASVPKALVPVAGRPMIDRVLDLYAPYIEHAVVVAHPSFADTLRGRGRADVTIVEQPEPTGMLDAILLATPVVRERVPDRVWITWCDQVAVLPATIERLAAAEADEPALVFPTVTRADPYIHVVRDASGQIVDVLHRREGDALPAAGESDMGLFALARGAFERLPEYARALTPGRATRERNFLPFIPWLSSRAAVATVPCTDAREAVGINTPDELRTAEAWLREREAVR